MKLVYKLIDAVGFACCLWLLFVCLHESITGGGYIQAIAPSLIAAYGLTKLGGIAGAIVIVLVAPTIACAVILGLRRKE